MKVDQTPVQGYALLKQAREARRLSLRRAAEQAGIDPAHLSRVERGERQLSVEALQRLAQVIGLQEVAISLRPFVAERPSS
ncbi:helix-turn-helix domain-containing protein [Actinomadura sp. LD22]|uniref:Helix-turn-helix domain-containing protein n=1 Tax=Actinomadura physcomitrii TaxID=2650748 RepID=A0A6I4MJJ2_9ACTN|nr:helix-turn-helix transcriptional regulator [Actinomadura physcomitrii]MWA05823.1 helix-turn-helix domain-containing protein [Actinomadura physcomitrii]